MSPRPTEEGSATARPEIIYNVASSLDGFIASADGGVDWLMSFQDSGEDYGLGAFFESVGAVLVGSRTYEQSLGFAGDTAMESKPCWVFTKRELPRANSDIIFTSATPSEVVDEMAGRGIARAWLLGGTQLAKSFREAGLITEYSVAIIPVVLGAGIPLFESPGPPARLELLESKAHPSGVLQLRYRVVRD